MSALGNLAPKKITMAHARAAKNTVGKVKSNIHFVRRHNYAWVRQGGGDRWGDIKGVLTPRKGDFLQCVVHHLHAKSGDAPNEHRGETHV